MYACIVFFLMKKMILSLVRVNKKTELIFLKLAHENFSTDETEVLMKIDISGNRNEEFHFRINFFINLKVQGCSLKLIKLDFLECIFQISSNKNENFINISPIFKIIIIGLPVFILNPIFVTLSLSFYYSFMHIGTQTYTTFFGCCCIYTHIFPGIELYPYNFEIFIMWN